MVSYFKNPLRVVLVGGFGLSMLGVGLMWGRMAKPEGGLTLAAEQVTFRPVEIPTTDPEIVNGLRGLYRWRETELVEQPMAATEAYQRYNWKDVEPSEGVYDFAKIEADVAAAVAAGRKFAFRIRDLVDADKNPAVPAYISSQSLAWKHKDTEVPDWNNPAYQARVVALVNKLGEKYNGKDEIAWIEIGMFGVYGNWTLGGIDYTLAPVGVVTPTELAMHTIVDAYVTAFANTQLLIMGKGQSAAISYAMGKQTAKPIGWKVECVGTADYFGDMQTRSEWPVMQNRWQTAPVVGDFCGSGVDPVVALAQVKDYHFSLLGNGNIPNWATQPVEVQNQYKEVGKATGYRLVIEQTTVPMEWTLGQSISINTTWANRGVAPVYEEWEVYYQLRSLVTGKVEWETKSAVDLKQITAGGSLTSVDTVQLGDDLVMGTYEVVVQVVDPSKYRMPLALANGPLGNITLVQAAPTPTIAPVYGPTACGDWYPLEAQTWWWNGQGRQTGGDFGEHVHMFACFPHEMPVTGIVNVRLKVTVHDSIGAYLKQLVVQSWDNLSVSAGKACNNDFGLWCQNFTAATHTCLSNNCVWEFEVPLDTTKFAYDGRTEMRFRAHVIEPNGKEQFESTSWFLKADNGKPVKDATYFAPSVVEARGWYECHGYAKARFEGTLPKLSENKSGIWTVKVAAKNGVAGTDCTHTDKISYYFVSLDPDYHNGNVGAVLKQGVGEWSGNITIDTRNLTNGLHKLVIRSDKDTEEVSDLPRRTSSGLQVVWFNVQN